VKIEIPLRPLAKAWQATQIAASDDEGRPVLYRTALVEVFEGHGLRTVSTDSYILVRAWVPFDLMGNNLEPDLDEVPDETFVVSDKDQRALGLLKYVAKLHKKQEDEALVPQLIVSTQAETIDDQLTFDGLEVETLRIAWQDHEEVVLRVVENEYPTWRSLVVDRIEATETISFTPRVLSALGRLGDLYPGRSIDWTLSGDLGIIQFGLGPLSGLLMPARPVAPGEVDS
jgi:hypothetical protein